LVWYEGLTTDLPLEKTTLFNLINIFPIAASMKLSLIVSGFILKIPIWDQPGGRNIFTEEAYWMIPEEGFPGDVEWVVEDGNNSAPRKKDTPVTYSQDVEHI